MNRFQNWYKIQPPALRLLLTVNVVLYLLWQVLLRHFGFMNSFFLEYLALDVEFTTLFLKPWSLITYNFLHLGLGFGGFLHILFNMLWLYWIGKEYEELHGPHRLFAAYIIAGIGGGLLTLLLHAIFPTVSAFNGPVVGASASVLGIMMCVATLYPFKSVALFLLGNIRLLYIVLGWLVLEAFIFSTGGTSLSAHWGGVLFGFLFAKAESNGVNLSSWAGFIFGMGGGSSRGRAADNPGFLQRIDSWLGNKKASKPATPPAATRTRTAERTVSREDVSVETTEESEVDRILDKISEHGYEALTAEEKRILYEASQR